MYVEVKTKSVFGLHKTVFKGDIDVNYLYEVYAYLHSENWCKKNGIRKPVKDGDVIIVKDSKNFPIKEVIGEIRIGVTANSRVTHTDVMHIYSTEDPAMYSEGINYLKHRYGNENVVTVFYDKPALTVKPGKYTVNIADNNAVLKA